MGLRGQMIPIPFAGTNTLSPVWWSTVLTNASGIAPWQAWQAVDTNFATLQGEFDYAVATGIPALISSALSGSGFAPQTYATGVSNNVTAATNALNAAIAGRGYLIGNQTVTILGDATGSGTTAITLVNTNIQPPGGGSTGQPLTKTATGVAFGPISATAVTGLTDADTNAVLNSFTWIAASTNSLYITSSTTNIMSWVLTNLAGVTYAATSGVPTVLWSTDAGTTWNSGGETLITNVAVKLAFFGGPGWGMTSNNVSMVNGDVGLTNVIVYSLTRPDLFGRTNQAIGQRMQVGTPIYPLDATPKSYVDAAVAAQWYSAGQDVQLNNFRLHLDSAWNLYSVSSNNALSAVFLGQPSWGVTYPMPLIVTNLLTCTVTNRTNVTVKLGTNGLSAAPALKLSHYLKPLNWSYVAVSPTIVGTNYVFSFVSTYPDSAWATAVVPSPNPGVFSMAVVSQLTPRTVTNSADSTWGSGAGLLCCDSNYVYFSVATNTWKRAALSSW